MYGFHMIVYILAVKDIKDTQVSLNIFYLFQYVAWFKCKITKLQDYFQDKPIVGAVSSNLTIYPEVEKGTSSAYQPI